MKIHNPNQLGEDIDLAMLRALARGEAPEPESLPAEGKSPVVRKGAAVPQKGQRSASAAAAPSVREPGQSLAPPAADSDSVDDDADPEEARSPEDRPDDGLKKQLMGRMRHLAQVIRELEALDILKPELLALRDYPGEEQLLETRRWRDLWRVCVLLSFGLALLGLFGWINAWVAGLAAGVTVILIAVVQPPLRQLLINDDRSWRAQIERRRELEREALIHLRMLEGRNRLAWQCQMLRDRVPELTEKRYERMVQLSRQGLLLKAVKTVAAFRFYLQYLQHARRGFQAVKKDYAEVSARLKRDYGFTGRPDADSE